MSGQTVAVSHSHPLFIAIFATLALIAFSFTNSYTAAPYIVSELGGSNDIAIYTIAFFGLGSALSIPLGKPLLARLHVRKMLIVCLTAMFFLTYFCSIAPNYPIYLLLRLLLGFAAGPLYTALTFSVSVLIAPEHKTASRLVIVTILTTVPTIAAAFGGVIAYEYSWRWVYYFNLPFFLILIGMHAICFRKIDITFKKTPFDLIGYLFFFIGVAALSTCAFMVQQLDWQRSPLLVALVLVGVPCFLFYVLWSLFHPNPILDLKLLKNPLFSFALFNLAVLFSAYFGTISLLSLWLKLDANYTPYWISTAIGTMAIAGMIPRLLIGGRFANIDPRIPLGIAILFLAISCFHATIFDTEVNFGRIAFSRVIAGFGLTLFLAPLFQMCFDSFPAEKSVDVIEIFQIVRNLAAGFGASFYDILWQRRAVFFHDRLGEKLTVFSQQTHLFFTKMKQLHVAGDPYAQLNSYLDKQASSLALDDCFWLMAWISMGLFIFLILTLKWTKLKRIE